MRSLAVNITGTSRDQKCNVESNELDFRFQSGVWIMRQGYIGNFPH